MALFATEEGRMRKRIGWTNKLDVEVGGFNEFIQILGCKNVVLSSFLSVLMLPSISKNVGNKKLDVVLSLALV